MIDLYFWPTGNGKKVVLVLSGRSARPVLGARARRPLPARAGGHSRGPGSWWGWRSPPPSVTRIAGDWLGRRRPNRAITVGLVLLLAAIPLGLYLYVVTAVGFDEWGGFMLNLFLAVCSIILCFPLGVLLALGRRSGLPLVRWMCTVYIEIIRGAPLFVLLLLANVALGFFVPGDPGSRDGDPGDRRVHPVHRRLHGRDRPRRAAVDPRRPDRGGEGARPLTGAPDGRTSCCRRRCAT